MNCKHLKIRSKKYKKYIYCDYLEEEIKFSNCYNCKFKEFKDYKPMKKNLVLYKNQKKKDIVLSIKILVNAVFVAQLTTFQLMKYLKGHIVKNQ